MNSQAVREILAAVPDDVPCYIVVGTDPTAARVARRHAELLAAVLSAAAPEALEAHRNAVAQAEQSAAMMEAWPGPRALPGASVALAAESGDSAPAEPAPQGGIGSPSVARLAAREEAKRMADEAIGKIGPSGGVAGAPGADKGQGEVKAGAAQGGAQGAAGGAGRAS